MAALSDENAAPLSRCGARGLAMRCRPRRGCSAEAASLFKRSASVPGSALSEELQALLRSHQPRAHPPPPPPPAECESPPPPPAQASGARRPLTAAPQRRALYAAAGAPRTVQRSRSDGAADAHSPVAGAVPARLRRTLPGRCRGLRRSARGRCGDGHARVHAEPRGEAQVQRTHSVRAAHPTPLMPSFRASAHRCAREAKEAGDLLTAIAAYTRALALFPANDKLRGLLESLQVRRSRTRRRRLSAARRLCCASYLCGVLWAPAPCWCGGRTANELALCSAKRSNAGSTRTRPSS